MKNHRTDHLENYYNDFYINYDSKWREITSIDKADNIMSLCRNIQHDLILDIGSGDGFVLKTLSGYNFGSQYYALDISSRAIENLMNKNIHGIIEAKEFNGYDIPFESNKFDLSIMTHVIEHVECPKKLLKEAGRVSKYVFIEVPLEYNKGLPMNFKSNTTGHINFYSSKLIRYLAQTCGFQVVSQIITNPGKNSYIYQSKKTGHLKYWIKNILLSVMGYYAQKVFTYHSALLLKYSSEK